MKYVQRQLQNTDKIDITVKFDQDQYTSVRQDYGMPVLDANTVNAQTLFHARNSTAVADTGASVDCSCIEMLKMMRIGRRLLLPASTVLCMANKQRLTVMGLVKEKVMFYVVKELQSIFLSKDTLVDMKIIPTYFPLPSRCRSYGTLAGFKDYCRLL